MVNATDKPVVMNDATKSATYCNHPVPKMFGFRSYISVPIFLSDGTNFGTVCALDKEPADVDNPRIISTLSVFGQLIAQQLEGAQREVDLQRAHDALKRRNEQLATFASVASHDLRSPLRGIGNLTTWAQEEMSSAPDVTRTYLTQISSSVRRMSSLVDGVLEYASAGEEGATIGDVRLSDIVDGIIELYAPLNATITGEGGDLTVRVKKVPLQHAGRKDAVIHVKFSMVGDELRCDVSDNGPGISSEHHERVWKLFQSLDGTSRDEHVSGVGLAIVKKLVENEGGRVWIDSVPGKGARFSFTWPTR